jgi:phospholipid-binding lipoprotein MlaA
MIMLAAALALSSPLADPPTDTYTPVETTIDAPDDQPSEADHQAITAMIAIVDEQARAPKEPEIDWSNPDPFEPVNRILYALTQPIDLLILRPAALLYQAVVPKPLRDGVHNALENIFTPTILANDILQMRPRRALQTLGRFVINSTLGVGGVFDMARRPPFNIPAHPNGLSDTLGIAGMEGGAYLYLPLIGPTNLRDLVGLVGDAFTQPLLINRVYHRQVTTVNKRQRTLITSTVTVSNEGLAMLVISGLDTRSRADEELQSFKKQSVDPYAALRSTYLQNRLGQIARLKAKDGQDTMLHALDDPLTDPAQPAR